MIQKHILFGTLLTTMAFAGSAQAGKKIYVGAQVPAGQQVSMDQIDHGPWDGLLRKYVDENGYVNYEALKASANDQQVLARYLQTLSTASRTTPAAKESQLAYWINAYNAVTVEGILQVYPTASIRDHTAKLYGYNIWKDLQLYVGGRPISLNDMEHEVLRKMGEPRIHFAIVCASIGCPRLMNQAYMANKLDEQLTVNAKDFFSREKNFRYDASANKFYLSSILEWFGEDFGSDQAARLKRIAGWLPTQQAMQAAEANSVSVSFLDYSWKLNDQKNEAARR